MCFRALCVGVGQLLPLPPLHSLDRVCLPFRVAGRTGSAPLPPLDLVVVSASGVVRGGSFFRTFGFPEVGAISFPDPFRRLSVPPLAGLEGQGCGALGCRGAEGWLLSALPQHSSSFQCSHSNAFLQPHLHQGSCSGGGHLRLNCQECCGACSTPFSSRLFVVWKTSGSWRPVIDLSHLIRFVAVSPFPMEPIQSVLLSVRQRDWMASIDLKEA